MLEERKLEEQRLQLEQQRVLEEKRLEVQRMQLQQQHEEQRRQREFQEMKWKEDGIRRALLCRLRHGVMP